MSLTIHRDATLHAFRFEVAHGGIALDTPILMDNGMIFLGGSYGDTYDYNPMTGEILKTDMYGESYDVPHNDLPRFLGPSLDSAKAGNYKEYVR